MKQSLFFVEHEGNYILKNFLTSSICEVNKELFTQLHSDSQQALNEINEYLPFIAERSESDTLSLYIVNTMSCNLTCSYCFEKGKHSSKKLNTTTDVSKIMETISTIASKESYQIVDVTFTGGEPLLNYKFLEKMVKSLPDLGDYKFLYSVITNGTLLTEKMLSFLNENKFNIQISLDGAKEFHDEERKSEAGTGSYDRIFTNIRKIKKYPDISLQIRINTTNKNKNSLYDLLDDLLEFKEFSKVYFDFVAVEESSPNFIEPAEQYQLFKKYYTYMISNGFRTKEQIDNAGFCMYKNDHGVTIDARGNLTKCYSLVEEKDFLLDSKDIKGVGSLCPDTDCFYYETCFGGCPFNEYVKSGEMIQDCKLDFLDKTNKYIFATEIFVQYGKEVEIEQINTLQVG